MADICKATNTDTLSVNLSLSTLSPTVYNSLVATYAQASHRRLHSFCFIFLIFYAPFFGLLLLQGIPRLYTAQI
jgi:hypothetical protein